MVISPLPERFLSFIRDEGLLQAGNKVVVGVSGGQDSITLFHLLYQLRHELGITLIIAHYNHSLRTGADRDQAFVRALAKKFGIPFITEKNHVRPLPNVSLEEFARNKRYSFFKKMVRVKKADCIVVAHTEDDLAETVLMRLLRGTGLAGLRAMLPLREINGLRVVRPLLFAPRSDIEKYVQEKDLGFVQDPSNRSLRHFRNQVRLRILPFLEKELGRNVRSNLASLATVAASDYDLIDRESRRNYDECASKSRGTVFLSLAKFRSIHPALRRSVIRIAIAEIKGDLNSFGQDHVTAIERLALRGLPGTSLDLPKSIKAKRLVKQIKLLQEKHHQKLERK